jgi:hypothetical protein
MKYVLRMVYEDGRVMYAVIGPHFVDTFDPMGIRTPDFDRA